VDKPVEVDAGGGSQGRHIVVLGVANVGLLRRRRRGRRLLCSWGLHRSLDLGLVVVVGRRSGGRIVGGRVGCRSVGLVLYMGLLVRVENRELWVGCRLYFGC
jgi:hypothetical protein